MESLLTDRVLQSLPRNSYTVWISSPKALRVHWLEWPLISYFPRSGFLLSLWIYKLLNSLSVNYFLRKLSIIHFSCLKARTLGGKKIPGGN